MYKFSGYLLGVLLFAFSFAQANAALAIVQSAKNSGTTSPASVTVTAPTNGNGLIAFVAMDDTTLAANTGWTQVGTTVASNISPFNYGVFRKTAGAGESTTQTPATATAPTKYSVIFYEVSGQAAGDFTDGNGIVAGVSKAQTVTSTSLTPTVLSDLWLNATVNTVTAGTAGGTPTANAALTLDQSETTNGMWGYHRTSLTSDTSTAIQYTFTSGHLSDTLDTLSVLIKPSAGGVSTPHGLTTMGCC